MKKEVNESERIVLDDFTNAKRINAGSVYKWCDTFKLEDAQTIKDVSFNPKKPELTRITHNHIFHTVDSYGRPTTHCNSVSGHTHEVKITKNEKGILVGQCSLPIRNRDSDKQEIVNYEVRIDGKVGIPDQHTHPVTYLKSEQFQLRQANAAALQYISSATKIPEIKDSKFLKETDRQ